MSSSAEPLLRLLVSDASTMGCELLVDRLRRARFEVAASVCSSTELVRAAAETHAHIALISADLEDGRLSGYRALREFHQMHLPIRSIVLLKERDRDLIISAFRGGARGVFFRAEPFSKLTKCIRSVQQGQFWASSADLEYVLEALATAAPLREVTQPTRPLTKREEQIATYVAQGLTNREIAQKVFLSEHTVKNYLFRIFEKLNISNRVELVLHCSRKDQVA